ncbi:hypothetical protein [Candidatus Magnetobacterium casense]|uniref:Uncharacterized protein n=1 Tax=Candidatus Magnetobacterium casense TaxID=1455061 RepID=A0ABS6RWW5_9BACT|nr:hypothetical protein [Candidatus Magnetobacterium casensis]MBV6340927.1 hypothetical protein [Candidatus Magnetobacterium casensis]
MPRISEQEKEMLIGTLRRLVSCREKKTEGNRILWLDKEDPTDTSETFKSLDALYSFVLASEALNNSLDEIRNIEANDDALGVFLRQIDEDFSYTFELINKDGFFPIPYLWQWDKPFDCMDMAAFCCEFCISVLKNDSSSVYSDSTRNAAKIILKKSINAIKNSVSTIQYFYVWKGWGNLKKQQRAPRSPSQAGTTYFTALCCSALSKYIAALDLSQSKFDMGFLRDDIVSYIKGGLKWLLSRYNKDGKFFYKYDNQNEQALYWGVFTLIAVCDAKQYFDAFRDRPIFEKAEILWKDILAETNNRILNNRDLYDTVTMQVDTPWAPVIYEDSVCLGSLTTAIIRYAIEFEPVSDSKDFVIQYLFSKITQELKEGSSLIMNYHYNIQAFLSYLSYKQPTVISISYPALAKIIDEAVEEKLHDIKAIIYTKVKPFEKTLDIVDKEVLK